MDRVSRRLASLAGSFAVFVRAYPLWATAATVFGYFFLFQRPFLLSGDIWAESYMEYLPEALDFDWGEVIASSWEGYLTLLPSFFSKAFVEWGGNLGLVDWYLRFVVVLFVLASLLFSIWAVQKLIPALWQRLVLCVGLLLPLAHVSILSFINVWYLGFVPIILLSLSGRRMKWWQQVLYVIFGVAVCLTKPAVILMPFLVYRAVKTKEYLSNALIFIAACWQTYLLFFATKNGAREIAHDLGQVIESLYIGCGTELLKLFHISPNAWLILLANLVLVGIIALLVWRRGWWIGGLLAFGYVFAVYSYVLAPGAVAASTMPAEAIFMDHFKLQREILSYELLIIAFVLLIPDAWKTIVRLKDVQWRKVAYGAAVAFMVLLGVVIYRPIDVSSGAVSIDIDPFRSALMMQQPTCMPVAPLPTWSPGTNWYFSYRGGCSFSHGNRKIDYTTMHSPLMEGQTLIVESPSAEHRVMSILMPVRLTDTLEPTQLVLQETASGTAFTSIAQPLGSGEIRFVSFNTSSLAPQETYTFTVQSDREAYLGKFKEGDGPAHMSYFMITAPPETTPSAP